MVCCGGVGKIGYDVCLDGWEVGEVDCCGGDVGNVFVDKIDVVFGV